MTTTEYSSNAHPRNECSEEREVKIDADNTLSDPQLAQTGPMSPASTNCSAESSPSEVAAPVNRSLGRSRLLPYNRRLRHLHGISIRNLDLSVLFRTDREQGQKERRQHQDRHDARGSRDNLEQDGPGQKIQKPPQRPGLNQSRRRRSTLNWVGKSPQVRQRRLEQATASRMADTWFSLHRIGVDEPIYVSEVVALAMNPTYRFFDMATVEPQVSRLENVVLKVWAKSETMMEYEMLVDQPLHLPSLQFVGKSAEDQPALLPSNCLLLHLSDGVYSNIGRQTPQRSRAPSPSPSPLPSSWPRAANGNEARPTSSYDALMRLSSLDECIQDAVGTQEKLAAQINSILSRSGGKQSQERYGSVYGATNSGGSRAKKLDSSPLEPLASLRRYVAAEKRQLSSRINVRASLVESLKTRREAMSQGRRVQEGAQEDLVNAGMKLRSCELQLQKSRRGIRAQRRRISEDLSWIYPVEPVPHKPLLFTIRDAVLQALSDDSKGEDPATTAAAIGYVCHVVHLLSCYLSVPLPYPAEPQLSTSSIRDDISMMMMVQGQRTFPLYPKNSVQYRFDYALFLLNKNIEFLTSRHGLKVLDLRQTLPNLKYLVCVLMSGDGGGRGGGGRNGPPAAPPRRLPGHVKGLLRDRLVATQGSP